MREEREREGGSTCRPVSVNSNTRATKPFELETHKGFLLGLVCHYQESPRLSSTLLKGRGEVRGLQYHFAGGIPRTRSKSVSRL